MVLLHGSRKATRERAASLFPKERDGLHTQQDTGLREAYREPFLQIWRDKSGGARSGGDHCGLPRSKVLDDSKKTDAVCGNVSPGKPDIDNIQKAVLDGLNGVAYDDDSQVVDVHCRKVYTDESGLIAGVYIRLTPVMDEWRIPEWLLVQ